MLFNDHIMVYNGYFFMCILLPAADAPVKINADEQIECWNDKLASYHTVNAWEVLNAKYYKETKFKMDGVNFIAKSTLILGKADNFSYSYLTGFKFNVEIISEDEKQKYRMLLPEINGAYRYDLGVSEFTYPSVSIMQTKMLKNCRQVFSSNNIINGKVYLFSAQMFNVLPDKLCLSLYGYAYNVSEMEFIVTSDPELNDVYTIGVISYEANMRMEVKPGKAHDLLSSMLIEIPVKRVFIKK